MTFGKNQKKPRQPIFQWWHNTPWNGRNLRHFSGGTARGACCAFPTPAWHAWRKSCQRWVRWKDFVSIQAKVAKVTKVHQFVNDSGTMNGNIYVTLMILMPLFWCFFSTQQLVRLLIRDWHEIAVPWRPMGSWKLESSYFPDIFHSEILVRWDVGESLCSDVYI
jgi:hypothetical protein